ncbi:MAG: hypothetical protein KAI35_06495 [Desulfobulbaceae bacterium]|nr:hypothetical protein [Desulfobulbaceae bacterium]
MGRRCGDEASLRWEVEAPLVGEQGIILLSRIKKFRYSGTYQIRLDKSGMVKIKWPDQEKKDDGSYYGGRKADFTGLGKLSHKERWEHQKFRLNFFVSDQEKRSGTTMIEGYPNKPRGPMVNEGIPYRIVRYKMQQKKWWRRIFSKYEKEWVVDTQHKARTLFPNCGKYYIELKDGVIWIVLKISYDGGSSQDSLKIFREAAQLGTTAPEYCNKRIENFWNGRRGFGGWVFHRKDCVRKEVCDCPVTWKDGSEKFLTGCCKVPIRLRIEQGNDIKVKLWDSGSWGNVRSNKKTVADTGNFQFPEPFADTYAHEAGHFMGFPDQYAGGHTAANLKQWPISRQSVMGGATGSMKEAHEPHVQHFLRYAVKLMGDHFNLMKL